MLKIEYNFVKGFVIVSGVLHTEARKREVKRGLAGIGRSITKLIIPAALVWLAQLIVVYYANDGIDSARIKEIIKQGGFGPGGYFVYIAVQNIIIGGIYYRLIQRYLIKGLLLILFYSILLDFLSFYHHNPQ